MLPSLCAVLLAVTIPGNAQSNSDLDRLPPDTGWTAEVSPASPPQPPAAEQAETWAGAAASSRAWTLYSGLNWAPFGSIRKDGWRLRLAGGYGNYSYDTADAGIPMKVRGTVSFADVMAGYQLGLGQLTLKLFAGATFEGHGLVPFDANNALAGSAIGWKAAAEAWMELSPSMFGALNASWASANDSVSGRLRLGRRLTPQLAVGLEGSRAQNEEGGQMRGGAFLSYQWGTGEVSISGGVSRDLTIDDPAGQPHYGTLVYLTRF